MEGRRTKPSLLLREIDVEERTTSTFLSLLEDVRHAVAGAVCLQDEMCAAGDLTAVSALPDGVTTRLAEVRCLLDRRASMLDPLE